MKVSMKKVKLRQIAHSRAGDKGNTSNISVFPYREEDYELIVKELTVPVVRERFKNIVRGKIKRYEAPALKALNFVMENALGGGVSRSLSLDRHGKSFSVLMLDIDIKVPDDYVPQPYTPTTPSPSRGRLR
jgi:hypothetical protein